LSGDFTPARDREPAAAPPIPGVPPMSTQIRLPRRGNALLLSHCAAFGDERPRAYERLEQEVGPQLARFLVSALRAPQGRRGASSP
jgi:hypothetical protein